MESNSARNMIQVSQATADHVLAAGKQHWLTPREDKIEAKGKGTMQVSIQYVSPVLEIFIGANLFLPPRLIGCVLQGELEHCPMLVVLAKAPCPLTWHPFRGMTALSRPPISLRSAK